MAVQIPSCLPYKLRFSHHRGWCADIHVSTGGVYELYERGSFLDQAKHLEPRVIRKCFLLEGCLVVWAIVWLPVKFLFGCFLGIACDDVGEGCEDGAVLVGGGSIFTWRCASCCALGLEIITSCFLESDCSIERLSLFTIWYNGYLLHV